MAEEEHSREQIRTPMDLNLYLGLPRRVAESDLGSDLALNSLPEMSSSNTQSYPSISQPYSPSYDPVSERIVDINDDEEEEDDDVITLHPRHPAYMPSYVQRSAPTAQDSTEAVVVEDDVNGNTHNTPVEYVPYSVSYVPTTPTVVIEDDDNTHNTPVEYGPFSALVADEVGGQEGNVHAPYVPVSRGNGSGPERTGFRPYEEVRNELMSRPFSFRAFNRLSNRISDRRSRRVRRYRSVVHRPVIETDHDMRIWNELVERTEGSEKASVEVEEETEEGKKEESNGAGHFECNVCLDVAKEPVVTSCGHLFCWPCLYQWLHVHCDHKECPVCKGEVTEENVTPIYGRGSSGKEVVKDGEEGNLGLKIPPRPRGVRLESLRQRLQRPFGPGQLGGEVGSWTHILEAEWNQQNRRMARVMSARRPWRELDVGGSESSSSATEGAAGDYSMVGDHATLLGRLREFESRRSTPPPALARRGADFWRRFAFYSFPSSDRLAAIAADLSSVVGRMANGGDNPGASASTSANPQGSNPIIVPQPREGLVLPDQASASSTIAVIQGESSVPIDAPAEPSSVGSSPTLRRRRRNTVSGSLDVDGVNHACKRRRLN